MKEFLVIEDKKWDRREKYLMIRMVADKKIDIAWSLDQAKNLLQENDYKEVVVDKVVYCVDCCTPYARVDLMTMIWEAIQNHFS